MQEQAVAPRSAVPHGRGAHGPEQRVRHELPARVLSEGRACRGSSSDESFFPQLDWLNQFRVFARRTARAACSRAHRRVSCTFAPGTVTLDGRSSTTGTDTPGLAREQPGQREPQAGAFRRSSRRGSRRSCSAIASTSTTRIYNKKTHDALISVPIAAVGGRAGHEPPAERRLDAELRDTKLQLNAQLVDMTAFRLGRDASRRRTTRRSVVDLGIDPSTGTSAHHRRRRSHASSATVIRSIQQWYHPYTYNDANHDGVLQTSEVHVDSSFQNFGNAIPRDLLSIRHRCRPVQPHAAHRPRCSTTRAATARRTAPTTSSATRCRSPASRRRIRTRRWRSRRRAIAKTYGTAIGGTSFKSGAGYFMNGQFWKLREARRFCSCPGRVNNLLRTQNGSTLVFSARNLHMWSSFTGSRSGIELRSERRGGPE